MKSKLIIATLLSAAMLVTLFAGCSGATGEYWQSPQGVVSPSETPADTSTPSETPIDTMIPSETPASPTDATASPSASPAPVQVIDYDAAFATFPPDTPMITLGDYTVTWAELFFSIRGNIDGLKQAYGTIPAWSDELYSGMTCADAVLNFSVNNAKMYKAVEYGATQSGITLTSDDLATLKADFDNAAAQNGGDDAFLKLLWDQNSCYNRDLFDYLIRTSYLADLLFKQQFGENGASVSDEDAASFTANDGYLMAKHILRKKQDGVDDSVPLGEMQAIKDQLDNYGGNDLEGYFDELMQANTEDTDGLSEFPDGYLFQNGDMVQEFYDACNALQIGQYSDIVETTYGYHIILRLPINYDVIPLKYYSQNNDKTLRNIAALGMFDNVLAGWSDQLTPVFTDAYNSIDFAKIFVVTTQ